MAKTTFKANLEDGQSEQDASPETMEEPKAKQKRTPELRVPSPILPDEGELKTDIPDIVTVAGPKHPDRNSPQDYRSGKAQRTEKLFASIGLSKQMLPPLTRKQTAIYELVNFKNVKDKRLEGRDQFVDPQPYELVPNYTITDEFEPDLSNREKTMTYYEGGTEMVSIKDPVTGKDKMVAVPKVGSPRFEGGQVVVSILNSYNRYVWWELHPRNLSNKRRNRALPPIFKRVDIDYRSVHAQTIEEDLKLEAQRYVREMPLDELIKLASAMVNPTVDTRSNRPDDLRLLLRQRAAANPTEILHAANVDTLAAIKFHIIDALNLGILSYFGEHNAYFYGDDRMACFTVPHDNDPMHSLAQWFRSDPDGHDMYEKVKGDLGYWK